MTTLPALSTPCTWNTFLARSTPMVLTCMWTTPSGDSLLNNHPLAHSMPGAGVVHHIIRVVWPDHGDFRSTPVNGHPRIAELVSKVPEGDMSLIRGSGILF